METVTKTAGKTAKKAITCEMDIAALGNAGKFFQFRYSHVPEGEALPIKSVENVEYTGKSGKTSNMFLVDVDQGLAVYVLPTKAIEHGLAEITNQKIVWTAQSMTKKTEGEEAWFEVA